MKICISNNLLNLKEGLEKRGYDILPWDSKDNCDALICDLKNGGLTNVINENSIKKEGILIIDIGSKTIDEIEYILNNRLYT
ncbi:YkuS family protein, partial [Clostridium arbusti]